jgi:MOSC domain-containing protein YiiM
MEQGQILTDNILREGIFSRVLRGGSASKDDAVIVVEAEA